jgi:hypothetical protein
VAISDRRHNDENNHPVYDIDEKLTEGLRSSLTTMFETKKDDLRKLEDVKTLVDYYKKTRQYKQQYEENGILSLIFNKIIEELLGQVKSYYIGSIVRNIEIQTRIKEKEGFIELNAKIDLNASLKPYFEFIVDVNKQESYSIRFTFQIETSGYVEKLRLSKNTERGKSIHIEKLGIRLELYLLQIRFSNLLSSSFDVSFDKKMKLGGKSFEMRDVSLFPKQAAVLSREKNVCSKCNTIHSPEARYCANCSFQL